MRQYDASPDAALAAVRAHKGPLLVDIDETLYLRNSTEDFIDCALLLRALDVLQPWRLTGGIDTRDTWRVCATATFFPWTRWRWRAKVPFFAERYVNRELEEALKARSEPPVVLTTGFKPIVAPLLAAMGFADAKLIAARMYSFADRSDGKLRMATRELGAETVAAVWSSPIRSTIWNCCRGVRGHCEPSGPRRAIAQALGSVYLPGEYIFQIKRPGSTTSSVAYSRRISLSGC